MDAKNSKSKNKVKILGQKTDVKNYELEKQAQKMVLKELEVRK